ncbi:MAG: hypothetical protein KF819_16275 [Labilithrix sp.]|nr:hypothetical protein [Labilithrix sp.]
MYAAKRYGDPASAIRRYGEPAAAPHVFVRGTLRRALDSELPAMCSVVHQRQQRCGRSSCWETHEAMTFARAELDVEWGSSPLPPKLTLSHEFRFEPRRPAFEVVARDSARAATWKGIAQTANLGFTEASLAGPGDRIVEACLDDATRVFVEGCVSAEKGLIEPCAGLPFYGLVAGEPQAAVDDAADEIALFAGGAALALLVAVLALVRAPNALVSGLEDRGPPHRRNLGAARALLAIPPLAGLAVVLMHGVPPPSTWATGRGGFALAITALTLWTLFALSRMLHRRRALAALTPVLATPRSLLAKASGTVELAVRARLRGDGVKPLIGDDVVAFSEARIVETYKKGKYAARIERLVVRESDELDVGDESGDGVLRLTRSILDVELRKVTMVELSPRYRERGIVVERHPEHLRYFVEERVIHAGEPLYVFGDVSEIALTSSEHGYRSVRGSPTLGGEGVAPVLVHAGQERGLVATLAREARWANSLAVVGACVFTALAVALAYLASL